MEIHLTPEIAAKLTHSAAQKGRNPEQFVQDVLVQYLEDEARFIEAVKRGEDALQRGDYLTHEQVGQRLDRFLRT
jgi:predicted transcriptional regulator